MKRKEEREVMVVEIYAGLTCQYPHISSLGVRGSEYHMRGGFLESSPSEGKLISHELFARGEDYAGDQLWR